MKNTDILAKGMTEENLKTAKSSSGTALRQFFWQKIPQFIKWLEYLHESVAVHITHIITSIIWTDLHIIFKKSSTYTIAALFLQR